MPQPDGETQVYYCRDCDQKFCEGDAERKKEEARLRREHLRQVFNIIDQFGWSTKGKI